jgi:transcriptional regulator with XRE-family HTH domain
MAIRSPFHSRLGEVVKEAREEKQLTQAQLGSRMDVPPTFISDIERGVRNPALSTLISLSNGLNTKLSELFARAGR